MEVVNRYRAVHQYALSKATMGLRSAAHTVECPAQVSQRLKRLTTIIGKLQREPTMQLANMHDIGGCRAVLDSVDELRHLEMRLRRNRPPERIYDYIVRPRDSGYRAVHVIVCYQDRERQDRLIEVQLRTKVMHEWAIFVERASGRMNVDLKGSQGPSEVLDFLRLVSQAMGIEEAGGTVSESLIAEITASRQRAVPYLEGGRS